MSNQLEGKNTNNSKTLLIICLVIGIPVLLCSGCLAIGAIGYVLTPIQSETNTTIESRSSPVPTELEKMPESPETPAVE